MRKKSGLVPKNKRIFITGIGIVSPVGVGKDEFWRSLRNGVSGVRPVSTFATNSFKTKRAAQITSPEFDKWTINEKPEGRSRSALLLALAAKLAIGDSGIIISEKNTDAIGVCTATTTSNLRCFAKVNKEIVRKQSHFMDPFSVPDSLLTAPSSFVSIKFNIQGFNATVSTGCTASLNAVEYAINLIRSGCVEAVLVTGVEEVTFESFLGFYKMGYLAGISGEELSCPFDKRRNGVVLGEGAVAIMIENGRYPVDRKRRIYAEITGSGFSFCPSRSPRLIFRGGGLEKCMARALSVAGAQVSDVDYISAAANSTVAQDASEALAIKRVFGRHSEKIPVSSLKSIQGETIGASGLFQVASVIGMMQNKFIAPTINLREFDEDCALNHVANKPIDAKIKTALINNWGETGHSNSLIVSSCA